MEPAAIEWLDAERRMIHRGRQLREDAECPEVLDPAVVSQLVGRRRKSDPLEELTPREREVLELMAEGRSNDATAGGSSSVSERSRST